MSNPSIFPAGVASGSLMQEIFQIAKQKRCAIPAVNVVNTDSINGVLEAARTASVPIIIQISYGGAQFFIGKGVPLSGHEAAVAGAVAAAQYVHKVATDYGVTVILHTDHAAKKLLPWIDGLLAANTAAFNRDGQALFSSHMLDFSEESLPENLSLSVSYFKKLAPLGVGLEIELGCTGGEEDGVDNTQLDNARLYTQPAEVALAYQTLIEVDDKFTIAASFGNVHGVYAPGNVHLAPEILQASQEHLAGLLKNSNERPATFVFHGGSGSALEAIRAAVDYGVVKMNLDTDLQWATWEGVLRYYQENQAFLQGQIGNPTGSTQPNKKYYDPRSWLRAGQMNLSRRLATAFKDLHTYRLAPKS